MSIRRRPRFETLENRRVLATLVVNSLADGPLTSLAGDGKLSLREAIEAAETNVSVDGSTAGSPDAVAKDQITFAPELNGTILLSAGELAVTRGSVDIFASSPSQIAIDAGANSRVLRIDDGNPEMNIQVLLAGLTLENGNVVGQGGVIFNAEALNLTEVIVKGGQANEGGGIYNQGTLEVFRSTLFNNVAGTRGGAILNAGSSQIFNSSLSLNAAAQSGGAIDNQRLLQVAHATVVGNTAEDGGGIAANGLRTFVDHSLVFGNFTTSGADNDLGGADFFHSLVG